MRKITKMFFTFLLLMVGVVGVHAEKLYADLSKYASNWNTETSTLSFSWTATYGNQLQPALDLPVGDLRGWEKLVVVVEELNNCDFFRILVYNPKADKSDFSNTFKANKTGANEFTLAGNVDSLQNVTRIVISGSNWEDSKNGSWQETPASIKIKEVYLERPDDPLALPKDLLSKTITKAKMVSDFAYTTVSFATLSGKITDGETALVAEGATAESLETATNDINNAINALAFKPGFSSLKDVPFGAWNGWGADATMTQAGTPMWTLFEATGQSYGDPSVNSYADVSGYEKLYITTASGTPRILLNRTADNGQWNENEAESNLIDNTLGGWSAKYFSQEEKMFVVDLKQLVTDKGFAHLTSIKSRDNNVVTGIYLYRTPIYIETDLTAQFSALTDVSKWVGASGYTDVKFCPEVAINDGTKKQVCEKYEATCATTGDVFYQTITGLAAGTYKIELYGGAAFTFNRGFGSIAFTGDLKTPTSTNFTDGQHIDENTGVKLYATTSEGTFEKEIPIYYAGNFPNGAATVILDGVIVGSNGELKIGMNKTSQSTNWHVVQLKGVTAQVNAVELHASTLAGAQTALADKDNAIITGKEKTALEAAIAANTKVAEYTADAYKAAIKALSDSLSAFNASKAGYLKFADAKASYVNYDFRYASDAKVSVAEGASNAIAGSAAEAEELAVAVLKAYRALAESSALAEGIEGAKNCTDSIKNANSQDGINGWTVVKGEGSGGDIVIRDNESFTDAADAANYKYFDGGDWGASAWDVTFKQNVTLKAGKYMLTATARAERDVNLYLYAGADSVKATCISSVGGLFNRGWNDVAVEFTTEKDSTIEIGVRGVTNVIHNWMSFTRFRLVQLEAKIDSLTPAKTALNDAIIAAKAVDTTGKTEESAKALTDAIADAEAALAAEGATVKTLNDAKTALEAAVAGLKDQPKEQIIPTEVTEPTYTYPASWDFTNWSDSTIAHLKADAAYSIFNGWSDVEKDPAGKDKSGNPNPQVPTEASKDNCFWHQGKTDAFGQLYAAGKLIEETKGLKFTEAYAATRGLAIAVNYPSTSLGEYAGGQYLWLGGGGKNVPCFVLPQVPANMQITMVVESHKPADARGVELYAGSIDAANKIGDSFKPTTQDTHTWDIETAGDIVVYNTSGCHIYSINVTENTTGIKSIAADGLNGTLYNMNGQKVLKAQKGLFIINGKKVVKK